MHIIKKILDQIGHVLKDQYNVYINPDDLQLFQTPLTNKKGEIDQKKFDKRQKKSIRIINEILKYHGKSDIVKFLAELASIEPKIQELQPWVRDHIVHAINTFILGVYILEKVNFPRHINARYGYTFMWKLSGPTHDLGYPIEIARNIQNKFIDKMNEIIKRINVSSPLVKQQAYPENLDELCNNRSASDLIQKRLTEWALGIDISDYYDWLKRKNKIDHGVISALAQLKVLDALYQRSNPKRKKTNVIKDNFNFNENNFILDIVSASASLFIHNIDLNYYGFTNKINFELAPLAFLLFLCDTFQEWDRYSENRTVYSGEDFDINCTNNSISLFVPQELENKTYAALYQRLSGLSIRVNGRLAVV